MEHVSSCELMHADGNIGEQHVAVVGEAFREGV